MPEAGLSGGGQAFGSRHVKVLDLRAVSVRGPEETHLAECARACPLHMGDTDSTGPAHGLRSGWGGGGQRGDREKQSGRQEGKQKTGPGRSSEGALTDVTRGHQLPGSLPPSHGPFPLPPPPLSFVLPLARPVGSFSGPLPPPSQLRRRECSGGRRHLPISGRLEPARGPVPRCLPA